MSNTRHAQMTRMTPPRAFMQEDGSVLYEVPSKVVRRLLQLGVATEREQRRRSQRRRMERLARRRNRGR